MLLEMLMSVCPIAPEHREGTQASGALFTISVKTVKEVQAVFVALSERGMV
jgi:hypothetical protein